LIVSRFWFRKLQSLGVTGMFNLVVLFLIGFLALKVNNDALAKQIYYES
jgi:hypothetical protein